VCGGGGGGGGQQQRQGQTVQWNRAPADTAARQGSGPQRSALVAPLRRVLPCAEGRRGPRHAGRRCSSLCSCQEAGAGGSPPLAGCAPALDSRLAPAPWPWSSSSLSPTWRGRGRCCWGQANGSGAVRSWRGGGPGPGRRRGQAATWRSHLLRTLAFIASSQIACHLLARWVGTCAGSSAVWGCCPPGRRRGADSAGQHMRAAAWCLP
jgi:hypothetical protein